MEPHIAGLPQNRGDKEIKFTYLKPRHIQSMMVEEGNIVSVFCVKQMIAFRDFRKRKALKMNTLIEVKGRDEQFKKINAYKAEFIQKGLPILSIDTKKKEMLGDFQRQGQFYSTGTVKVNDHDFKSFSSGQLVPHGIYDVTDNTGYMTLGTDHDTSAFVCDNIRSFWYSHLQFKHPDAHTMLLLCDGGGSNSCLHYCFKKDLCELAKQLSINILVAHYPAYCSKYNPIEHRLFSQISHTWNGVILKDVQAIKELTLRTTTKTGLKVCVNINKKIYQINRPLDQNFKNNINQFITFDDICPKWNYLVKAPN